MSYILDALKKSERQRPPGPVPDLFTVHGPQPPTPRVPTRAIVTAVLLVVAATATLGAWFGTADRDEDAAQPPAAASIPLRAEAPAAPVAPRPVAAVGVEAGPASAPAPVPARKPFDNRPKSPAPPARIPRGEDASTVVPVAIPEAPPRITPLPSPAAPDPGSMVAVPMPALPATITPAPAVLPPPPGLKAPSIAVPASGMQSAGIPAAPPVSPPEPVPVVPPPEQSPPADGRVLELSELPASVRAELPKLLVSGHVWSEEPSLRLMSVDDRLLHEGGEAAPGLKLQEITSSGAVFVFKGWYFRVAGGRP